MKDGRFVMITLLALAVGCNPAEQAQRAAADAEHSKAAEPAAESIPAPAVAEPKAPPPPAAQPKRDGKVMQEPAEQQASGTDKEKDEEKTAAPKKRAAAAAKQEKTAVNDAPSPEDYLKNTPLIPREKLFGNPDKAAARISPDGANLAYLAPVDGVINVWVGPSDDPEAANPVTQDKLRGIRRYFWAYTNEHVMYLQDVGGDEDWHVYCVDLATHNAKDLTPIENVSAQIQAVSHRIPGEILVWLNDRDPQFHDVYRVDLVSGKRELIEKNTQNFVGYVTDEDLRVRLASR